MSKRIIKKEMVLSTDEVAQALGQWLKREGRMKPDTQSISWQYVETRGLAVVRVWVEEEQED